MPGDTEAPKPFHSFLVYAWHFAKCPGMSETTHHSHKLVSYDRDWLNRMHSRISNGSFYGKSTPALSEKELEQIELEYRISDLTQQRKSLEWDVKYERAYAGSGGTRSR